MGVVNPQKGKHVAALELQHPLPSISSLPHFLETCCRAQLLWSTGIFFYFPGEVHALFLLLTGACPFSCLRRRPKVPLSWHQRQQVLPVGPFSPFQFVSVFWISFALSCNLLNGSRSCLVLHGYIQPHIPGRQVAPTYLTTSVLAKHSPCIWWQSSRTAFNRPCCIAHRWLRIPVGLLRLSFILGWENALGLSHTWRRRGSAHMAALPWQTNPHISTSHFPD